MKAPTCTEPWGQVCLSPSWGLALNGDKENKCVPEQIIHCGDETQGDKQTAGAEGGVSLWGTVLKGAVREGFSEEVTDEEIFTR